MKYFESNTDFSSKAISNPVDLLRFVLASVFLSPIRLILEISRKCLFLGEYFNKFIMNAIYLNLAFLVLSLSSSFFVTKRFYLKGSFLPVSSIIVSLVLLLVVYYLGSRFNLEVDFELTDSIDDVVSNLEEVYGVQSESIESSETDDSSLSLIERINKEKNNNDEKELELINEDDFDKLYDNVVDEELKNVPSKISNPLKARLESLKSDMKNETSIHSRTTAMLSEYQSVRDYEESNVEKLKGRYSDVDDDFEDIKITDLIRRGKTVGEEKQELGELFDDDPINFMDDINSYSNKMLDRVNRRSNTLDNLIMSENSSSVVSDVEDDPNLSSFNSVMNSAYSEDSHSGFDDDYVDEMDVFYNGDVGSSMIGFDGSPTVDFSDY